MASAVIDVTMENKQDCDHGDALSQSSVSMDNSLLQSPSIESFSTFQDTENLSELNMDENADLCVKVDSPQKHLDTLETYVTFRITTRVARIEFLDNEYVVRRRYNDFIWLRQRLLDAHPTHIIPPLPGKHSLMGQLDRYSKDFILARMKLLNIFMSRLANHPILSCNDYFKAFLTAKQTEFSARRKSRNRIERPNDSFSNISGVALKNRAIEFERARDYLQTLTDKLMMIDKISVRICKERADYVNELNNFWPVINTWASTEPELNHIMRSIADALEKTSLAHGEMTTQNSGTMTGPVREFLVYVESVKEVLHKRDGYQLAYESSLEELDRKRAEKELVSTQPANHFTLWKQTSDQRLEKLGAHIPLLVKQTENDQDKLECANEAVRSDLARWHSEKQACLKKLLLEFATKQVELHERTVSAWEKAAIECAK